MKPYLLMLLGVVLSLQLKAQELKPCGSPSFKSEWLKKYQKDPSKFDTRSGVTTYVPLKIHLVARNDGTGRFGHEDLYEALCTLNDDFAQAEMEFFIYEGINYINNSALYEHESVIDGGKIMLENNVDNAINCYFVFRAAGNCGYNLPWAGVVTAHNCAGPSDHTWAHEIGHNLSLPHPFLGWEGGQSWDGSVPANFGVPAPERVTYNYTTFKDQLYEDTLIIDTAYVEKVDGSNCSFAADGFCDTKPDYLAARWPCNGDKESNVTMLDPDGTEFRSDATLIMSYANDNCSGVFSPEQVDAMKANLTDEKPELLFNQDPPTLIAADYEMNYLSPLEGEIVPADGAYFEWEPVENATAYLFVIGVNSALRPNFYDTIVTTTSFTTSIRRDIISFDLYYGVMPLTDYTFCPDVKSSRKFEASEDISNVTGEDLYDVSLVPTVSIANQIITIQGLPTDRIEEVAIYNTSGLRVDQFSTASSFSVKEEWSSGLYLVRIKSGSSTFVKKLIVE